MKLYITKFDSLFFMGSIKIYQLILLLISIKSRSGFRILTYIHLNTPWVEILGELHFQRGLIA